VTTQNKKLTRYRSQKIAIAITCTGLLLSACASAPAGQDNDPYEATNRKVFAFNMALDKSVALPAAKFYRAALPDPVRTGIHNALTNLAEPIVFSNEILQGHAGDAGVTLVRFAVNSTFGIGGLVDVGAKSGLTPRDTDFGITLGIWGAGEGPYLMLPLVGPAPPRDLAGMVGDSFLEPVTYIDFRSKYYYMAGRAVLTMADARSRNIEALNSVERMSIDFYAATRSLYLQNRNGQIRGDLPPQDDGF
jgi:phospholipid-binding lipoprotein MlaA